MQSLSSFLIFLVVTCLYVLHFMALFDLTKYWSDVEERTIYWSDVEERTI